MILAFNLVDIIQVPFGYLMEQLYRLTSSYGMALILFSILVQLVMLPITARLGLTYSGSDAKKELKFTGKQVATLAVLLVVGIGCVFGYLSYYYKTTSLSAKYSTEERYEKNTQMTQVLAHSENLDPETAVTIVESAYKKFLSNEITYTVAVYTLEDGKLEGYDKDLETIRGLSKSKAKAVAEDGVMSYQETATIVLDDKTGQVLSLTVK